ncbi:hypothetical protein BO83DRAFT_118630 [Aspergillus eucalypticola CBS 122712]|uniref:Uncharacterized protein n=1 Tax=Aspergillus eucalypticola (strain CBS 122712 / IBT 29274) TaxID=1448314 RepID=A0A317UX30_ASPEC|nr:uncharacterized protein BO83DRAFT_118630 [Aspergillus eucalypticola CBS 122712]PWY65909.1 hypothetical protein BO83DRAFT_118630 [Aspergillus eucalypticola CBS 122712]
MVWFSPLAGIYSYLLPVCSLHVISLPPVYGMYILLLPLSTTTMTTTLSWLVHSVGGYCWVEMVAEILCGALHSVAKIWFLHLGSKKKKKKTARESLTHLGK